MKKIAVIIILSFFCAVSLATAAFGLGHMIIHYKNGQTQTIDLNTVRQIEFQDDRSGMQNFSFGIRSGQSYRLVAKHSGKCLDVSGVSGNTGANVYQWDCHSGPNQLWTLTDKGGGYFLMTANHSGKCLDVSGVGKGNGANIYQWDCHSGPNQLWQFIPQGQGYYKIVAQHSGKCMDVSGAGKGNGANVHQWDCHGGDNQLWQLK